MARAQNPNIEILEIASIAEYNEMGKRLRDRGFEVDPSRDAPICRWVGHGILLDVMPTDESILGFSNYWYASAIKNAKRFVLPNDMSIPLINASHFLATKLAAFDGRGEEDYVMSHDLEDVICVIDGRPGIEDEVRGSATDLRQCICSRLKGLLKQRAFPEALPGHLPGDPGSQARLPDLVAKLERLAGA